MEPSNEITPELAALLDGLSDDSSIEEKVLGALVKARKRIAELEAALKDCVRVMSLSIYPKPDAGPDHPWSVLMRAMRALDENPK